MLIAYTCNGAVLQRISEASDAALRDAVWIDLLNATEDETRRVAAVTGLHVPTEADLREIESSSRLSVANGVLTLSLPLVSRLDGDPQPVPGGFVLSQQRVITIRFAASSVFDSFAEREMQAGTPDRTGAHPRRCTGTDPRRSRRDLASHLPRCRAHRREQAGGSHAA